MHKTFKMDPTKHSLLQTKVLYFNTQPSVEALNPANEPEDAVPAEDAAFILQQ